MRQEGLPTVKIPYLDLFSLDRVGRDDPTGNGGGRERPLSGLESLWDGFSEHGGGRD